MTDETPKADEPEIESIPPKRKRGKQPYIPNDEHRGLVEAFTVVGLGTEKIAKLLQVSADTVERYYRKELDTSSELATAKIGGALFKKAMSGDTTAQIFWMKTRGRWRETDRLEITGANGGPITMIERVIVDPKMLPSPKVDDGR